MNWVYNDGGRADAGFKGEAGDCVTRAIAIAMDRPYKEVYNELASEVKLAGGKKSARNGVGKKIIRKYLAEHGWTWNPTMFIGSGCRVHLGTTELPLGTIIASVSKHITAVKDGVVHDTRDCTRGGKRCVYGYWTKEIQ